MKYAKKVEEEKIEFEVIMKIIESSLVKRIGVAKNKERSRRSIKQVRSLVI